MYSLDITSQIANYFAGSLSAQVQTQLSGIVTTALSGNLQSIGIFFLLIGVIGTIGGSFISGTGEAAKAIGKPLIVLGVILLAISILHS